MAVEYEISSDVATITGVASNTQVANIVKFYTGSITYDDEPTSKYASVTINGKTQRVMLCVAVSGTVNYDDVPCLYSTVSGHRTLNVVEPTESGTPDDVPSLYETVVVDGKTVRALRCVLINATPNYDGVSSTCTFTDNGKTHTAQLVNQVSSGSIKTIVKGVSPLSLPDAVAGSLSYVKAFGGTEQRNLPDGYTELEYIESTGTQYIDTGIIALETDEITVIGTATTTGSQFFFSQGASSDNQAFQLANTTATNGIVFDLQNYDPYRIITGVYAYNNVVTVRIANKEIFVNGTSYGTSAGTLTNPTDTMRLFISSAGAMYNIQMQRFTITGKIDLVPAKNASGVVGMYDLVSGQFFTNQGTGTFTAGPEAVPTPDAPMDIVSNNGVIKARHQSGLPLGYTLLDYIESSGTQYIDTGIKPNGNYTVIVKGKYNNLGTGASKIYGSRTDAGSKEFIFTASSGAGSRFNIGYGTHIINSAGISSDTDVHIFKLSKGVGYVDNTVVKEFAQENFEGDYSLYLFGANYGGTVNGLSDTRIYYEEIDNANGVLIQNLIPARRNSDSVLGMYDLVSGQFFTNAGTGDFVAGNTVSDPVEVYADGLQETIAIKDDQNTTVSTATCQDLLSVGNYTDEQEVISGGVTRKVGVKVLDGTENWDKNQAANYYRIPQSAIGAATNVAMQCTHFNHGAINVVGNFNNGGAYINFHPDTDTASNTPEWKTWLATQYANGTPVIVVYPLATPTTESVAGQTLQVTDGDNVLEITQASLDNLELEAKYSKSA